MSAKKIAFDLDTFGGSVASIKKDLKTLKNITIALESRSSKSGAMDAFSDRTEEIKGLISRYETLLGNDIKSLENAAKSMEITDAAIATALGATSGKPGGSSKDGGGIR